MTVTITSNSTSILLGIYCLTDERSKSQYCVRCRVFFSLPNSCEHLTLSYSFLFLCSQCSYFFLCFFFCKLHLSLGWFRIVLHNFFFFPKEILYTPLNSDLECYSLPSSLVSFSIYTVLSLNWYLMFSLIC